jgi:LmbE family N-acetylglucosaminyl deacetylase
VRLLGVFAHPDDESYSVGGCMARYAEQGVASTVLCFTRGEAGMIGGGSDATRERLGDVREAELREACRILGCSDVRIVGTPDGGTQADRAGIDAIARIMGELRPEVVVTMEPAGVTRHPDHIAVSAMTTAAFERVRADGAVRKLYYSAVPESAWKMMRSLADDHEVAASGLDPEDPFAVRPAPDDTIACAVDVSAWADRVADALRAHRTQSDEFIGSVPPEVARAVLSTQFYQRPFPPRVPGARMEEDLFAGLR